METQSVQSGKDILNDFFSNIDSIPGVDKSITKKLKELFENGKLTDTNIKNALQKLREDGDKTK